jgi:hypothetical protein
MFGSHHHLQRASLATRPVELFSISSQGQNPSVTRQGLSAASPNPALCRQDYRLPGGGRSASSLRASCRLILEVNEPTRAGFGAKDRWISNLCAHTTVPRISIHFAPIANVRDVRTAHEIHPRSSAARFPRQVHFFSKDCANVTMSRSAGTCVPSSKTFSEGRNSSLGTVSPSPAGPRLSLCHYSLFRHGNIIPKASFLTTRGKEASEHCTPVFLAVSIFDHKRGRYGPTPPRSGRRLLGGTASPRSSSASAPTRPTTLPDRR